MQSDEVEPPRAKYWLQDKDSFEHKGRRISLRRVFQLKGQYNWRRHPDSLQDALVVSFQKDVEIRRGAPSV